MSMPRTFYPVNNPSRLKTTPDRIMHHPPVIDWLQRGIENPNLIEQHHLRARRILLGLAEANLVPGQNVSIDDIWHILETPVHYDDLTRSMKIVCTLGVLRPVKQGLWATFSFWTGKPASSARLSTVRASLGLPDAMIAQGLRDTCIAYLQKAVRPDAMTPAMNLQIRELVAEIVKWPEE